ncbi:hypothetical protein WA158_004494 [Blastocystis sp. Blastoise]
MLTMYYTLLILLFCNVFLAFGEQGGGSCSYDIQCGVPAANLVQLREETKSLTGKCVNKTCECSEDYSCSYCHGHLEVQADGTLTTYKRYNGESTRWIDVCSIQWGGNTCYMDSQCYNGLCIHGKCVCYKNWVCGDCSLGLNEDILNGAYCGLYVLGKGQCSSDKDCGTISYYYYYYVYH